MAQVLAATTWNREICFVGHQTGRGLRLASARALTTPVLLSPAGGGRDIEDENDMQLVVLIARGVLDRIFQDQELVLFPIPVLEPDPVGAFSGKISSSWAARRVLVSPVWRDLRLWCQCRKHGVRAQAGGRRHLVALEREGLGAPGSAPGVSVGRMGWKSRPRRSGVYPGLRKPDGNAVTGRLSCWAMPLTLIIPLGKGRPTPLRTVRMIA